ncbi:hypothetical protein C8R43DRAFT_518364 [Mycena crocata]|nr:hypothetical protein C8R43DRAFT_518364 [Mycena crocata]
MSSAALEADRARVAVIDAQILTLEESIRLLRIQKQPIQDRLDACKYPVLTLPTEITSEIFTQFLPLYPSCPPMTGSSSPTLLTHICRRWRNIALANPALWRAIALDATHAKDGAQELLKLWLNRSGCRPISIYVEADGTHLYEAIQLLNVHRARWEHLELLWIAPETISLFSGPVPTPLLRNLQISMDEPSSPALRFDEAPLLRSAFLGYNASTDVNLHWQQLTSLNFTPVFASDCTTILQETVNLLHCRLSLFPVASGGPASNEEAEVVLPQLESLEVHGIDVFADTRPVTEYLATLIAPALRRLEVQEDFLGSDPSPPLAAFISKSGCNLQELQIIGRQSLPEDSYHNAFPSISNISFRV